MRALILSDSHGQESCVRRYLQQCREKIGPVDAYIHLGDGVRDFDRLQGMLYAYDPNAQFYCVKGNCDFLSDEAETLTVPLGSLKLLLTHGHLYGVKTTLSDLDRAAKERDCQIALFGHTHQPCMEMKSTLLINPGSAADGRLAVLEEAEGKPRVRFWNMNGKEL